VNACRETIRIFDSALGGAQHCQCGNYTLVHAATFDWLLGKFPEGSHVNQGLDFSAARTASRAMSGSMDYFLRSPRLGFRCWREDDLPLAIELWGDAEVTALIGGPFTPEQVGLRLAKEIAQIRDFHMQLLAGVPAGWRSVRRMCGPSALSCGATRVRVWSSSLPAVLGPRIGERGRPRCHRLGLRHAWCRRAVCRSSSGKLSVARIVVEARLCSYARGIVRADRADASFLPASPSFVTFGTPLGTVKMHWEILLATTGRKESLASEAWRCSPYRRCGK
jgi:hypothetical protein